MVSERTGDNRRDDTNRVGCQRRRAQSAPLHRTRSAARHGGTGRSARDGQPAQGPAARSAARIGAAGRRGAVRSGQRAQRAPGLRARPRHIVQADRELVRRPDAVHRRRLRLGGPRARRRARRRPLGGGQRRRCPTPSRPARRSSSRPPRARARWSPGATTTRARPTCRRACTTWSPSRPAGTTAWPSPSAGQVIAWGSTADSLTNVPASLGGVTAIAAGRLHSLALTVAGTRRRLGQQRVRPGPRAGRAGRCHLGVRRRRAQPGRGRRQGRRLGRQRLRADRTCRAGCPRSPRWRPGPSTAWP